MYRRERIVTQNVQHYYPTPFIHFTAANCLTNIKKLSFFHSPKPTMVEKKRGRVNVIPFLVTMNNLFVIDPCTSRRNISHNPRL